MTLADVLISAVILAGAVYLLYRSVWKKQGYCHGCASGCGARTGRPDPLVRLPRGGSGSAGTPPSRLRPEG